MEDDRGARERLVERQQAAVVEAGRQRLQAAVDAEDALALADERVLEGRRSPPAAIERRPPPDRRHAGVHDLDRVAVGAAVLALVQDVELLERLLGERAVGERDAQLVALADVAAVERADHLDVLARDAVPLAAGRAARPRARRARG